MSKRFFHMVLFSIAVVLAQREGVAATPALGEASLYAQPIQWVEDNGEPVQFSKWQGKETLISMAYSDCKRVCIATLHRLEEAQALADQKKLPIDIIVVSLNPRIDSPATWTKYRKYHGLAQRPNWHFLTGSEPATRKLGTLLGISFWMDVDHVIHDFKILHLDAGGKIEKYIDWDHQDVASLFAP